MTGEEQGRRRRLHDEVEGQARRKLTARREGDRGVWFGLGMFGLVGWSVAVPTLVGIAIGLFLDGRVPGPGRVSWTLTGLAVGIVVGCLNAWYWVERESRREDGP